MAVTHQHDTSHKNVFVPIAPVPIQHPPLSNACGHICVYVFGYHMLCVYMHWLLSQTEMNADKCITCNLYTRGWVGGALLSIASGSVCGFPKHAVTSFVISLTSSCLVRVPYLNALQKYLKYRIYWKTIQLTKHKTGSLPHQVLPFLYTQAKVDGMQSIHHPTCSVEFGWCLLNLPGATQEKIKPR